MFKHHSKAEIADAESRFGVFAENAAHPINELSEKQWGLLEPLGELLKTLGHDPTQPRIYTALAQVVKKIAPITILLLTAMLTESHPIWLALGMVLDLMSFTVTAPSTGTAMSVVAGDPNQIRNGAWKMGPMGSVPKRIVGIAAWTKAQAVGTTQFVWPSGADQVRGNRYRNLVNQPFNVAGRCFGWRFRPQDPLSVTQVGSATAGDVELAHLLLWYEDLPGTKGTLIDTKTLQRRGVQAVTLELTVDVTAASTYSGPEALNAESNLLLPDTDYAVLGCVAGVACGAIAVQGVDNGGLRWGLPGNIVGVQQTAGFFEQLASTFDLPLIPVINSANVAGTFVSVVQDENITDVPLSFQLVQLDRRSDTPNIQPPATEGPANLPAA